MINCSFLLPLLAAVVLYFLVGLVLHRLVKIRLITLLVLAFVPLGYAVWMTNRVLAASMVTPVDLFRINNLCYTIGTLFLVFFVDLTSKGNLSWKSIVFAFWAGGLTVGALFLDVYTIAWDPCVGWIQLWQQPFFYIFLYLYVFIIAIFVFGWHITRAYQNNKGTNKKLLKRVVIIFYLSILGVFVFTALRQVRLLDYPYVNSLDALFFTLGFGYIAWKYIQLPHLFHLDVLDIQLFGLFVYDNDGPLLYSYQFQPTTDFKDREDMITAALSGIDTLIKDILSSDEVLQEIRQESNVLLLERGDRITLGLVCNLSTLITRNWLLQFRLEFEKIYTEELAKYFATHEIRFAANPDALVRKIFYYG
jgi:hypothetical protein